MKLPRRERFGGGQPERNIAALDVEPKYLQSSTRLRLGINYHRPKPKKWPFKRKAVLA